MAVLNQLQNYGIGFQIKVLSSLIKHKEFLQNIHDILDAEYFDNPAHKWVVEEILRYYYKYHAAPTLDALSVETKKIENDFAYESEEEQNRTENEYDCSGTDGYWSATDVPSGGDDEARHWQGHAY